ncbi:N-acetylmuramoyl-L-alanine amidase [Bacillus sp. sid0103]|uniref:peptidoglycan recognition protein family protein n=1 Tax=Bacillus sp. sid0103 TaxID=2856337 RepID=UPI001C4512E0|nr:peptidoglycan recognition family protein [Bacillus sp. sid0103]MBV7509502.1 N-acetylmuramoyl-L-alanine amidase [Bacillus sp. sid0103]
MKKIALLICLFFILFPSFAEAFFSFEMKYPVTEQHLTAPSERRPGLKMHKVLFIVAHDTGNDLGARHNVIYQQKTVNKMKASAHIFVDDKDIVECIPSIVNDPEVAWQVRESKPYDNQMYGEDANYYAIGVELSIKPRGNNEEAYKRYIWTLAYLCYKYGLNPETDIVGHHLLDPKRKIDPENGLRKIGKTYEQLLQDVVKEYESCIALH